MVFSKLTLSRSQNCTRGLHCLCVFSKLILHPPSGLRGRLCSPSSRGRCSFPHELVIGLLSRFCLIQSNTSLIGSIKDNAK